MVQNSEHLTATESHGAILDQPLTKEALQCLIVAGDQARRSALSWVAENKGWKTVRCADIEAAQTSFRQMFLDLAVIDLEQPGGMMLERLEHLVQHLAQNSGMLLVVCGNAGAVQEEIWARQAGVWMYLPGVNDVGDLSTVLGEAHYLANRVRNKSAGPKGSADAQRSADTQRHSGGSRRNGAPVRSRRDVRQ